MIGSGVAGLAASWLLQRRHGVTLYERAAQLGGHCNTVDVPDANGNPVAIDTGFIVYNEATYPNLVALFRASRRRRPTPSEMSFAVSLDGGRLEYSGDRSRRPVRPAAQPVAAADSGRCCATSCGSTATPRALIAGDWPGADARRAISTRGAIRDAFARGSSPADGRRDLVEQPASKIAPTTRPPTSSRFFRESRPVAARRPAAYGAPSTGGSRVYVEPHGARRLADRIAPRRRCACAGMAATPDGVFGRGRGRRMRRFDHVVIAAHADQALAHAGRRRRRRAAPARRIPLSAQRGRAAFRRRLMPRRRARLGELELYRPPRRAIGPPAASPIG